MNSRLAPTGVLVAISIVAASGCNAAAMAYVDRDGVRIFYEAIGDGPPVLLTHGYSATSGMWAPQRKSLSADHQLIVALTATRGSVPGVFICASCFCRPTSQTTVS